MTGPGVEAELTELIRRAADIEPLQFRIQHRDRTWRYAEAVVTDMRAALVGRRLRGQRPRHHRAQGSGGASWPIRPCTTRSPACPTACCWSTACATPSPAASATTDHPRW